MQRASSLRCRAPDATLELARAWATRAGIIEVIDITEHHVLGVPVYMGRRSGEGPGTLAYGKGLAPIDAEVGAYMEAIEFAHAEPGTDTVPTRWGTVRDVAGANPGSAALLEFGLRLGCRVEPEAPLLLALARDLQAGEEAWLPAELVFRPAPDVGQTLFGTSTNGLASGNSVVEATVHALGELIERDIWSFEFVRRTSRRVRTHTLPDEIRTIVERAASHGLELVVRTILNEYELPFFVAFLFDPAQPTLRYFNGGWGCHFNRSIALARAVAEAAQGRAAYVHGGRGEPRRRPAGSARDTPHRDTPRDEREQLLARMAQVRDERGSVSHAELDAAAVPSSLEALLELLLARIAGVTSRPVYRSVYTPPDSPLSVVRVIAPLLESFSDTRARVGHRLKSAIEHSARLARAATRET